LVITSPIVEQTNIEETPIYEIFKLISLILDRPVAMMLFGLIGILGYFAFKD
jgi:hypothetical protein